METLLLATDFSKPADNAAEYAAHLARFLNARLVLVHAFSLPIGGYDIAAPLETIFDMQKKALERLKLIREQLISHSYDFGIEVHAELGTPFGVLEKAINKFSADMVVMGMTGEAGAIKEHFIGSNSMYAARNLPCPVMIIPENLQYKPIRAISLAAEMSGIEENTLIYSARDLANMFDATLEIVTVEKADKEKAWTTPESYSFVERRLKDTRHKQVHLREDNVAMALEYYFKFHNTDLVMVNPKQHSLFQKLFSESITRHLAFHSRVPLLVIH
jgi:nucleotide-binding universal stress UspA family protein